MLSCASRFLVHSKNFSSSRLFSMRLQEVVGKLNGLAPTSLAESWDNVGLLLEPYTPRDISTILLTNDLTEAVMDEAEEKEANLILSYHPPLFRPFKKITNKAWKERIVARCLEKGVAIYSPHTCWDALQGGVNDWLIKAFGDKEGTPITPSTKKSPHSHRVTYGPGMVDTENAAPHLSADLAELRPKPDVRVNGSAVEVLCTESCLADVISSRPHWSPVSITKLENVPIAGTGMGRQVKLDAGMSVGEAVEKVKGHLGMTHLRLALAHGANHDSEVRSVAVCAGSGSSVLRGTKVDLWVSGEMSHHEVLDATHQGTSVILAEHSNTERGYLKVLQPRLQEMLGGGVKVLVSQKDCDPLQVV